MPVPTVALLHGPICYLAPIYCQKEVPWQGAVKDQDTFLDAEDEPQDYYLCPGEDIGVCCWRCKRNCKEHFLFKGIKSK